MLISVTDYLVCDLALAPIPVTVGQRAIDKRGKKNKGTDEEADFHGVLPFPRTPIAQ
jgi:hypothetical protein